MTTFLIVKSVTRSTQNKLNDEIDRLCRLQGYPHIKLTFPEYDKVLKLAHKKIFGR